MKEIKEKLIEEYNELEQIKEKAEKSLENAPEGKLRVIKGNNRIQYYNRLKPKESYGKYVRKKDISLAKKLAQKEYDINVIKRIEQRKREILSILKSIESLTSKTILDICNEISKERKELIQPYILPDDMYVKLWKENTYKGKEFVLDMPEIYTEKGERVRSKSEKIIADKLALMNIPYHYEYPLKLKGFGIVYPDFLLLNKSFVLSSVSSSLIAIVIAGWDTHKFSLALVMFLLFTTS